MAAASLLLMLVAGLHLLSAAGAPQVRRARGSDVEGAPAHVAQESTPASTASASSARPIAGATRLPLRATLAALIASLADEVRAALPAHPHHEQYRECARAAGTPSDRCQSLTADVINYALHLTKMKGRIGGNLVGLGEAVDPAQLAEAVTLLTETATNAHDPLERISALLLMHYDGELSQRARDPLPEAAYRDLVQKPLPEIKLIAERHRQQALTGTRVSEFVRLADSADTRALRASTMALGHPETARELHEVVLGLPLNSETWTDLATALGRCGLACAESLKYLVGTSKEARIAVYEALGIAPRNEVQELIDLALAHAPAELDARERALRDELLQDAISD